MSAPQILVVDDEVDIRELVRDILTDEGYAVTVAASADEAREARDRQPPDLVLLDIWMPDLDGISLLREWKEHGGLPGPVVMMSGHGTVDTAVEATRLGAFDFIEKPLSMAKLLRTVERALEEAPATPGPGRPLVPPLVEPIGKSPLMQRLREQVRTASEHDATTLLIGEAGSGREAFARYLHSLGRRKDAPFINMVSAALTQESAAEALFGRDTDDGQTGYLERARGGVLFINELSDMPEDAQRLLLSALEQGSYTPVEGSGSRPLDVQCVTSVQPDYEGLLHSGRIRRDLLAHLEVIRLEIPSLRDYAEDVPDLLRYYVDVLVDREQLAFRRFSVAAQNRLRNYPWPGNIRELKNMVHRLLIMGGAEEIGLREVEGVLEAEGERARQTQSLVKQDLLSLPLREAREAFERAYLLEQLKLSEGKVGKLAERVGMERTNLYRKLRALDIDIKSVGGAED